MMGLRLRLMMMMMMMMMTTTTTTLKLLMMAAERQLLLLLLSMQLQPHAAPAGGRACQPGRAATRSWQQPCTKTSL